MVRRNSVVSRTWENVAVDIWDARLQQFRHGLFLYVLFLTETADAEIVLRDAKSRLTLTVSAHRGVLGLDSVIPLESGEEFDLDLALYVATLAPQVSQSFGHVVRERNERQAEILPDVQICGSEGGGGPSVFMGVI